MVDPAPPDHHPEGPAPGHAENPSTRHERSDVNYHWFAALGVGALVLAAFIHGVLLWFQYRYQDYQASVKRSDFPLNNERGTLPAGPVLEPVENLEEGTRRWYRELEGSRPPPQPTFGPKERARGADVYLRREEKERLLTSYGLTGEAGFARIPIDRAMDILVRGKRLSARKGATGFTRREGGLLDSGESNSGRVYREK